MAENKKGFVLYADQKLIFDDLTNDEAGFLIKHIFAYVNDENPILEDRLLDMAFKPIKLQLKRDLVKYEGVKERNSINARKRWDAVASSGMPKVPSSTKNADKDKDKDKDKGIDKGIDNNKVKNIPEYSEFLIYALEKKPKVNQIDLKLKYDSWITNDWKNGNDKKITNWKTALLNTLPYIKEVSSLDIDKPFKPARTF